MRSKYPRLDITIRDVLRRNYRRKTVNITISVYYDLLDEIESFSEINSINSRSLTINFLIHQGLVRIREKMEEEEA